MYAEGKNKGAFGKHTLSITDTGITATVEVGESVLHWPGIERIVEVPGYTFIYLGALMAYVVSEQGVDEGDYTTFIAELKRRWEEAHPEIASG